MLTRPAGGLNEYFFFVSYGPIWTSPLTKFTHSLTYPYLLYAPIFPATYKTYTTINNKIVQ